jgi:uncharacterized phosphosugar-binding protein
MLQRIAAQHEQIGLAADWFSAAILANRVVHLFGAGHSRIMVEEMWPRYGSFPGFNPIVELSLTFHNAVAGANGQRQAMFLENTTGLADRILRNFDLSHQDAALIVSSSGCNTVPIEMAQRLREVKMKVVALVSEQHSQVSSSNHPDGAKLTEFADLVLDTGAPAGDAIVHIDDFETPVAPGSTVGGCMVVNALKAEIAARLVEQGCPPPVLTSGALVGRQKSQELFDQAYDEHARLAAKVLRKGKSS